MIRDSEFSCIYFDKKVRKCEAINCSCIMICKNDCSICEHFDYNSESVINDKCVICKYFNDAVRLKKKLKLHNNI